MVLNVEGSTNQLYQSALNIARSTPTPSSGLAYKLGKVDKACGSLVECVLLPEEEVLDAHELLEEVGHVDGQLGTTVDHVNRPVRGHVLLKDLGLLHYGDLQGSLRVDKETKQRVCYFTQECFVL